MGPTICEVVMAELQPSDFSSEDGDSMFLQNIGITL
jgi:hypothetical protein